jgi:hypothetical protein
LQHLQMRTQQGGGVNGVNVASGILTTEAIHYTGGRKDEWYVEAQNGSDRTLYL